MTMKLKIKRFAPYVKDRLSLLVASFEGADHMAILQSLTSHGSYRLKVGNDSFEIVKDDIDLTYMARSWILDCRNRISRYSNFYSDSPRYGFSYQRFCEGPG